jgi:hypothetical protein
MKYKQDFEQARIYWNAFWAHDIIDRPCTMVFAKKGEDHVEMPCLWATEDDFGVGFSAAQKHLDSTAFLGEATPGFRPGLGSDQMAAFFGMPLKINPESCGTSRTEKLLPIGRILCCCGLMRIMRFGGE